MGKMYIILERIWEKLYAQNDKDNGIHVDMVIPVPDSGVPAALGYASESKVPFKYGIIRNHYVGRTYY